MKCDTFENLLVRIVGKDSLFGECNILNNVL